jgi:hypothetical protein
MFLERASGLDQERAEGFFEMTRASMTELIDDLTTAAIH